jgi:hypothetical protein
MLAGRLRRGSGITGFGAAAWVAPVVAGPFCGSDALIWTPSRAFGAGLGSGTLWADAGIAVAVTKAAVSNAMPVRMQGTASRAAIRNFGFLFKASSCLGDGHFIVLSAKGDIVFP